MRRVLLVLTAISFAGWSQPAQQPTQAPIPVKIEMPTENIWVALLKVVLPTVLGAGLGAGITLYGIRQNNKHELEKLNREHSFALKRDVLIRVTQSLVQTLAALKAWHEARQYPTFLEQQTDAEQGQINDAIEAVPKAWAGYESRLNELEQVTAASSLAVSDELWKSAQTVAASIVKARSIMTFEEAGKDIIAFTQAARKELGIVHIDA